MNKLSQPLLLVQKIIFGKTVFSIFWTNSTQDFWPRVACLAIFTMIFSFFFMPETFGLTLEEIEELYRQENPISGEKKHWNKIKKETRIE